MTLRLVREPSIDGATLGILYVDGHFYCHTIEDQIREVPGQDVAAWKVPGKTAIPSGRYQITITPSQRFKRDLPLLVDVPGFAGVRIHPGNTIDDTEGCILPGKDRAPGKVIGSAVAFERLYAQLQAAAEVWIDVLNPDQVGRGAAIILQA